MLQQKDTELMQLIKQQAAILNALTEDKLKAVASTQTATTLFDSAGIFNIPGLDPNVISAYVRPWQSISSVLPLMPSNLEFPYFASFTGFTADDGTQPELVCDDAPTADMKSCTLTAQFGVTRYDTKTIEPQQILKQANAGINTELNLAGQVLGLDNVAVSGLNQQQLVKLVEMAAMITAAAQAERKLVNEFWQGVVTNTNEFPGLDVQIATGQVDAKTNQACPALDSDVKDFNYNDVVTGALDIAEYLEMLEFYLRTNADGMGLSVDWVICMRPNLWQVLSQVWPIKYNTIPNLTLAANERVMLDARDNTRERDRMRNTQMLTINGTDYPVIADIGIFESNNINDGNVPAGSYASSIYMVPLRANGIPITFREYLDYRQWNGQIVRPDLQDFWTDDGIYSWAVETARWCHSFALKTEQRIVLRSPQLAGRIDNVLYTPLQHTREPDPDSPYHYDGGVSIRGAETAYAVWGNR